MIRPLTIATLLMACGSGLYLYQSKHEVQLLDRTIERTVRETGALREQSRLLATEWTMLNDPERLRQFSDTYLGLKTIAPSQFTSLADLDNRLPAVLAEIPAHGTDEPVPESVENAATVVIDSGAAADEALPVPPIPAPQPLPAVAAVVRSAEPRAFDRVAVLRLGAAEPQARAEVRPAEPHATEQHYSDQRFGDHRSSDQRSGAPRIAEARSDVRGDLRTPPAAPPRPMVVAAPRPVPASPPSVPAVGPRAYAFSAPSPAPVPVTSATPAQSAPYSAPYSGSLLGMARAGMRAAPRPTPVNASYNGN